MAWYINKPWLDMIGTDINDIRDQIGSDIVYVRSDQITCDIVGVRSDCVVSEIVDIRSNQIRSEIMIPVLI